MRPSRRQPVWSAVFTVLRATRSCMLYLAVVVAEALIYIVPLMDPGTLTAFGASPFADPVRRDRHPGRLLRPAPHPERRGAALLDAPGLRHPLLAGHAGVGGARARSRSGTIHEVWVDACVPALLLADPVGRRAQAAHPAPGGAARNRAPAPVGRGHPARAGLLHLLRRRAGGGGARGCSARSVLSSLLFVTIDSAIVLRFAWRDLVVRVAPLARALRHDAVGGRRRCS